MDASTAKQRLNKALDNLVYVSTLKERQKQAVNPRAIICGEPGHPSDQPLQAQPWSRADLFRRARTFKSSTWFCKPDTVNAVECAKHGWINTEIDKVQCEFCMVKIGFPALQSPSPMELAKAAETFHAMLSSAHDDTCFWKNNTTPLHLAAFPTMPPEQALQEFDARVQEIQQLPAALPPISNSLPHHMDTSTWSRVVRLAREGPTRPTAPHTQSRDPAKRTAQHPVHVDSLLYATARMLALFGWQGSALEGPLTEKQEGPAQGVPGDAPAHTSTTSAVGATTSQHDGNDNTTAKNTAGASPVLYCAYCGAARLLHTPPPLAAATPTAGGALEGPLATMKQRAADAAAQAAALRGTTLGAPGALRLMGPLAAPSGPAHTIAGGVMQGGGTPRASAAAAQGGGLSLGVGSTSGGVKVLGETIAGGRLTPVVASAASSPTHSEQQQPSSSSPARPARPASTAWQQPPSRRHDVVSASTFHTWLAGFGEGSNSTASSPRDAAAGGGGSGIAHAGGGGGVHAGTAPPGGAPAAVAVGRGPSSGPFGGGGGTGGVAPLFGVAAMRAAAAAGVAAAAVAGGGQVGSKRPAAGDDGGDGQEGMRPAKRVATAPTHTQHPDPCQPTATATVVQPPLVPTDAHPGGNTTTRPQHPQRAHVNTSADVFDPIHHHRSFCPWITSPKGVDALGCGWRVTLHALVPCTDGGEAVGADAGVQEERDREWSASRALKAILPKLQMRM